MWKQNQDASMATGYEGGWCLKFVQDAFGTDHPYATALDAWNNNYGGGNHPNELPPAGKTVPVYFSLGNVPAGHVAISLDDGMVASSTQGGIHSTPYFHQNLDNLIWVYGKYNGGCTYLGWSEYVGTYHVVEWDEPVVAPIEVPVEPPVEPPVVVPVEVIPPVVVPDPAPIVVEVPVITPTPDPIPVVVLPVVTPVIPVVSPIATPQPILDPTPAPVKENFLIAFLQKVIQFLIGYNFKK